MFEESLIGQNPTGTDHPRIITAAELAFTPAELDPLLDRIEKICAAFDIAALTDLLCQAPLDYQPQGPDLPPPAGMRRCA